MTVVIRPAAFQRPVEASGVSAPLIVQWIDRAKRRRVLRTEILSQPDSVLEDFGLTREAADIEAAKPFWRG